MATPRVTSRAYETFESVAERSLNLLSLEETFARMQEGHSKSLDLSDLSRAAVVLAVAAMDAYFTDVFAENLVGYLKSHGARKKLVELLASAGLDTATAIELLAMKRPFRRIRSLMENHLERRTTQRPDAIDELFLAYGIKDFCNHVQGLTRRKTLITSIQKLVERRHQIAHDGDLNGRGRLQKIDVKQTRRKIEAVVAFVAASERLLNQRLHRGGRDG